MPWISLQKLRHGILSTLAAGLMILVPMRKAGAADLPLITLDPALVCSDVSFHDLMGEVRQGLKDCSASGGDSALLPENIKTGVTIAGVTGAGNPAAPDCASDGQLSCVATAAFPAVMKSSLADRILTGQILAGVAGAFILPPAATVLQTVGSYGAGASAVTPTLAACASDGASLCHVLGPSLAAASLAGAADKIIAGQTLAGVSGQVVLPAAGQVLGGISFGPAALPTAGTLSLPLANKVHLGSPVFGDPAAALTPSYTPDFPAVTSVRAAATVDGAPGSLLDCAAAHSLGCVTSANYPSIDLSAAGGATGLTAANFNATIATAANFEFWDALGTRQVVAGDSDLSSGSILTGTTVFGVSGSAIAAPATCASDGAQNCVVAGSSYAASSCAAQGSNCYLPAYITTTQPLKAISYDAINAGQASFRSSLTLAGLTGTLGPCTAGNQSGCETTTIYKSMDLTAAGTATGLTSANFNATLASSGNFEFWDASGTRHSVAGDVDLAAANIQTAVVLLGKTGAFTTSPGVCASDGDTNCTVDGTTYAAAALVGAGGKIISGQSHGSVAGNVVLPAVGKVYTGINYGISGSSLTGTLTLPSASDVLSGSGSYGDPGAPLTPSLSPDFPALANVRSLDTVNGTAGTLADCSAGNQSACFAVSSFKSMDLSAASTMTDLTAANLNTTLATAANFEFWDSTGARHQATGTSELAGSSIISGTTLFGVTGTVTPQPTNCSSAGSQACYVTGSYFAGAACAANASQCFLPAYALTTQPLKAISYDAINTGKASIRSSLTISGIAGTLANCSSGNATACVATSTYRSIDLSAAGTDTGLTTANFASRLPLAANSEFWDASGTRQSVTGDTDLSVGNIKAGVTIHGVTGQYPSTSYRLTTDTAATDLTSFAAQLTTDGSFEFFDSAGLRYSGSGDSDLVAGKIKNTVALENFGLSGTFRYDCPTNWLKVPGDSAYGTNDYCLMKYEPKNVGGVATSQAANTPWTLIDWFTSIATCRALGTGYDLLNNNEWLTVASHVASRNVNWTGGTVGTGYLFTGHTDNDPALACAASSNDTLNLVESTCTPVSTGDTAEQARTFTLSNGEVIWDLAGNLTEWTNTINRGDKEGVTTTFYEFKNLTGTTTSPIKDMIPTQAVKSYWLDTWSSTQRIGMYYPGTNGAGGPYKRGNDFNTTVASRTGLFTLSLSAEPTDSSKDYVGFRCLLRPPNP